MKPVGRLTISVVAALMAIVAVSAAGQPPSDSAGDSQKPVTDLSPLVGDTDKFPRFLHSATLAQAHWERKWTLHKPGTVITLLREPSDDGEKTYDEDSSFLSGDSSDNPNRTKQQVTKVVDSENPQKSTEAEKTRSSQPIRVFIFEGPAAFPLLEFGGSCEQDPDEGLTITESMVVRASNNGDFEVEFQAISVAIPVVLRLQLLVHLGDKVAKITLPSITLDPIKSGNDQAGSRRWMVAHRGKSQFLANAFRASDERISLIEIERRGAARFGSGVEPMVTPLQ